MPRGQWKRPTSSRQIAIARCKAFTHILHPQRTSPSCGLKIRRTKEEITMLKIFAVSLLAVVACASAASARGGGADTMPGFSYTDLPPYHPQPLFCQTKRWCAH